jgi:hypothetical protein
MEIYNHKCSCGKDYTDDDPDLYFCPICIKSRKQIAEEVNKKMINRVNKRASGGFASIVAMGQTEPSSNGGTITFIKAGDLGL